MQFGLKTTLFLALLFFSFYLSINTISNAQAPGSSKAKVDLQFPKSLSVGRLMLLKSDWKADTDKATGRWLADAKGSVKIGLGQPIALIANDCICQNISCMRKLTSDALSCLILNGLTITNSDLAQVAHLKGLRRIELADTDIDDLGLSHLSKLSSLEFLCLSFSLVKGDTLDQLSATHLKKLQLDGLVLSIKAFRAISNFANLRSLAISRSHVTNEKLAVISHMPMLEELKIAENVHVNDVGIMKLIGLKHLRILDVSSTSVTPDGLIALKGLDLKWLKVSSCYKNESVRLKLQRAFPQARIEFEGDFCRVPVELFAPLH